MMYNCFWIEHMRWDKLENREEILKIVQEFMETNNINSLCDIEDLERRTMNELVYDLMIANKTEGALHDRNFPI